MSDNTSIDWDALENEEDTRIWSPSTISGLGDFYKENEQALVWWTESLDRKGEYLFSFDKKKIYNLFADYPHNLTEEEVRIFDEENPYWRDFFKSRKSST